MKRTFLAGLLLLLTTSAASAHEGAHHGVHFVAPADGAVITGEAHIVMAVNGMVVHKAGDLVKGTGHFHVIVDAGVVAEGEVVAKDVTHVHFGKGQTETTMILPKGEHTLTLQLADGHHVSYGKAWSQTIRVVVK